MKIIVLKTLSDMKLVEDKENHPFFKIAWNEAGSINRIKYIIENPSSNFKQEIDNEILDIKLMASKSKDVVCWIPYLDAIKEYENI